MVPHRIITILVLLFENLRCFQRNSAKMEDYSLLRNSNLKSPRDLHITSSINRHSSYMLLMLKVPKHENFSIAFFALSEPIWVCDVGTVKKIEFFYRLTRDLMVLGFWPHTECAVNKKNI